MPADRALYLQFRLTFQGPGEALLEGVGLTLLNAKDGPPLESAQPAGRLTAVSGTIAQPAAFSRELWGADEDLRFDDGSEIWPQMYVPVKKLVVHHTATTMNYADRDDAMAEVRAIYTYHARTLGWGDIGYNSIIDRFGNIYEGRFGREFAPNDREFISAGVVAGHALSHNYGSTGIALLGTFTKRGEGGKPGSEVPGLWRTRYGTCSPGSATVIT